MIKCYIIMFRPLKASRPESCLLLLAAAALAEVQEKVQYTEYTLHTISTKTNHHTPNNSPATGNESKSESE